MDGHQVSLLLQYRRLGAQSCLPDAVMRLSHHAVLHVTVQWVPCRPNTPVRHYRITLILTKCCITLASLSTLANATRSSQPSSTTQLMLLLMNVDGYHRYTNVQCVTYALLLCSNEWCHKR